jgi:uncharacterized protein YukE
MAVDSRVLLAGLQEYWRVLEQHASLLKAEFANLDTNWRHFSSEYEGEAADQFRANWIRTTQNFEEYMEQSTRIQRLLEERIAALADANRSESGLI